MIQLSTLLNGCWLNVYKPKGISSHTMVSKARRILKTKKIGHGGTLDPLAEGVLPLAIGECTKLVSYLLMADKTYEFDITFGESRTTDDAEGDIVETSEIIPSQEALKSILNQFLGPQDQVPPLFSAIKQDGKRLCDQAREGSLELSYTPPPRPIVIHNLEFVDVLAPSIVRLRVHCSKGTYVRSLARDISKALNTVGYVSYLKRSQSGFFKEKDAIFLDQLEQLNYNDEALSGFLTCTQPLDDILVLSVCTEEASRFRLGQFIELEVTQEIDTPVLLTCDTWVIGLGLISETGVRPKRVFTTNVYR